MLNQLCATGWNNIAAQKTFSSQLSYTLGTVLIGLS